MNFSLIIVNHKHRAIVVNTRMLYLYRILDCTCLTRAFQYRFILLCIAPGTYSPEKCNLENSPQYTFGHRASTEKLNDTPGNPSIRDQFLSD